MNDDSIREDDELPLEARRRIDHSCNAFEDAWKRGDPAPIEAFLQDVPEWEQGALLRELLSIDLHYRRQGGQQPRPDEYERRFPACGKWIAEAFLQESRPSGGEGRGVAPILNIPCPHCHNPADEAPAAGVAATIDSPPPAERPGQTIGPYKLLELIGEGGMGEVWMAEQREPMQRKVALKIIKAGMDTRAVVARFEAERQALALMDHPNIAKVTAMGISSPNLEFSWVRTFCAPLVEWLQNGS